MNATTTIIIDIMNTVTSTFVEMSTKLRNDANWLTRKKVAIPIAVFITTVKKSKMFFHILYFQGLDLYTKNVIVGACIQRIRNCKVTENVWLG